MSKKCEECGGTFEPNKFTPYQKFCSKRCKEHRYTRLYRKTITRELRAAVIKLLGGVCVACDISDPLLLTIDHINNDRKNDTFQRRDKRALYRLIRDHPEQRKRFQLLCWNCNSLKQFYPDIFATRFPWLSSPLGS